MVEIVRDEFDFECNSEAQLRFYTSRTREILLSSGYGKGKTRVLCEKGDLLARYYPGARIVLSRRTLASMWATTIDMLISRVIPSSQRATMWRPHAPGGATLYYPNGSEILCVGLDDPGRALSGAWAFALIDQAEELGEEEAGDSGINGRLRQSEVPWRQWAGVCNPREPNHWLCRRFRPDKLAPGGRRVHRVKEEMVLADGTRIPAGYPLRETLVSGKMDNYGNLPPDYKLTLANMRGRYKLRYVDGLWVAFEGMVYDQITQEPPYVVPRPEDWVPGVEGDPWRYPPADWPRYRSIDWGFEHPFVCGWFTADPDGRLILYREIYYSHRDVEEHRLRVLELERRELRALRVHAFEGVEDPDEIRRVKRRLASLEMAVSCADHDRGEREYFARRGVYTMPARKDVLGGIQNVYTRLAIDGTGQPRLVFLEDALDEVDPLLEEDQRPTRTVESLASYKWKPPRESGGSKEEPVKVDDDGADMVRMMLDTMSVADDST